jgi:hypothetical protein
MKTGVTYKGITVTSDNPNVSLHIEKDGTLTILANDTTSTQYTFEDNMPALSGVLFNEDIKGDIIDGTKRGSLHRIVQKYFKQIGDVFKIKANSDKTIRAAFYSLGWSSTVRTISKNKRGAKVFMVTRANLDNAYTNPAKRKQS